MMMKGTEQAEVRIPVTEENGEQEYRVYYRRGTAYAQQMARYIQAVRDTERMFLLDRPHRVLVQAMREQVTDREAQCMELYYVHGYNFRQISKLLRINPSTISRNIQRGERKINRVLTLARDLLGQDFPAA